MISGLIFLPNNRFFDSIKISKKMKKIAILFLIGTLALIPEFSQASDNKMNNVSELKEINGGGRRKKNGSYRKKKGFLWGIFKGKSQCDCPKH
jgi:hypothetical protein